MISLKSIALKILKEHDDSSLAKVSKANDNYYDYLDRNRGIPFSKTELNFIKGLEDKPSDIKQNEVVFIEPDILSNRQKINTIRKFQKGNGYSYISFKSVVSPTDISATDDLEQNSAPVEPSPNDANSAGKSSDVGNDSDKEKDDITIYFSGTFTNPDGDLKLFYNFLESLNDDA